MHMHLDNVRMAGLAFPTAEQVNNARDAFMERSLEDLWHHWRTLHLEPVSSLWIGRHPSAQLIALGW